MKLADHFVQELMKLSRELETLLHWKKDHEHKVESYDELVAKLVQTEEELEAANRISYGGAPKARQPSTSERGSSPTIESLKEDVAKPIAEITSPIKEQPQTENQKLQEPDQNQAPVFFSL